jgi:hypothetical protein
MAIIWMGQLAKSAVIDVLHAMMLTQLLVMLEVQLMEEMTLALDVIGVTFWM